MLFIVFFYNIIKKIQFNLGVVTLDLDSFSDSQINSIKAIIKNSINNSKKKYLIFIDDLDRINPEEAISVLDLLKNILVVEWINIVFVVAADDEIVKIWLKEKYKKDESINYNFFYNNYLNKIFDIYLYPFPANIESIKNILETEYSYLSKIFINENLDFLCLWLLKIWNSNFRNIKSILIKYELLHKTLSNYDISINEEELKKVFMDCIVYDIEINSINNDKFFKNHLIKTKDLWILYHLNQNSFSLVQDTIESDIKSNIENINLKFVFSWPAYLPQIFYIIKNKDKIWLEESRKNSSPDILYSWTYNFIKILWLWEDYNNKTNTIKLTSEWDKIYEIIKILDNDLLYEYKPITVESSIKEYEDLLELKLWKDLIILKNILEQSIKSTIWYKKIKKILDENKEWIERNKLFEILSKDLEVSIWTLGNRVPSMLQLAIFIGLIEIDKNSIIKTKKRD